jgi:hypothetical protein
MSAQAMASTSRPFPQGRLWFGAVAGAAAWGTQGLLCVAISGALCKANYNRMEDVRESGGFAALLAITVVLLLVSIAGALVSHSNWRILTNNERFLPAEATGREQYMAFVGVIVNVVFALGIIWAGLAVLLLNMCVRAR